MSSKDGFYIYAQLLSYNGITPKLREDQAVNFYYRDEFRTCIIEVLSQMVVLSNAILLDAVILLPWGKLDGFWKKIRVGDDFSLNDLHRVLAKGEVLEIFDA